MRQVSDDLKNAARVDGPQRIPPSSPASSCRWSARRWQQFAVFNMIPIWNDLWFPLILAPAEETKTLTLGSQVFIGQFVTDWNAVLSALSMAILPVLVLYVIFSAPADPWHHLRSGQMIRTLIAGSGQYGLLPMPSGHHHHHPQSPDRRPRQPGPIRSKATELETYPLYSDFETALSETKPDLVVHRHLFGHPRGLCLRRHARRGACLCRKAPLDQCGRRRARGRHGQGNRQKAGCGLHPAPSSLLDPLLSKKPALLAAHMSSGSISTSNQAARKWETHKALMQTTSPIVDCGVALCRRDVPDHRCPPDPGHRPLASGFPTRSARTCIIMASCRSPSRDDSVGWYEAGWGPMMSETAFFVKDIVSPQRLGVHR